LRIGRCQEAGESKGHPIDGRFWKAASWDLAIERWSYVRMKRLDGGEFEQGETWLKIMIDGRNPQGVNLGQLEKRCGTSLNMLRLKLRFVFQLTVLRLIGVPSIDGLVG
jgi:hypothetical protein